MSKHIASLILTIAFAATGFAAGALDDRDTITYKNRPVERCYVDNETVDEVRLRTTATSPAVSRKRSDIVRIDYYEMNDGPWPKAQEAKQRGSFEEAADLYNLLAATGTKEWQKVYGFYYEGDSREMAGKYAQAISAFEAVSKSFPTHPLGIDALYRGGFAQALAGNSAAALKVADALAEQAKKAGGTGAEARANAIRAAAAYAAKDPVKLMEFAKKATFRQFDDPELWFHFGMFHANALRTLKKSKEAELEYRKLVNNLDDDPGKRTQASLGLGICMIEADRQGAILELLSLDALPYGSPSQKCEARYQAGKLMWEEAAAAKAAGTTKDADFLKNLERNARSLLSSAANAAIDHPSKDSAKAYLDKIGPDPDEKKAEDAAAPAAGEDAAPENADAPK